jgi:hypothetical protein
MKTTKLRQPRQPDQLPAVPAPAAQAALSLALGKLALGYPVSQEAKAKQDNSRFTQLQIL